MNRTEFIKTLNNWGQNNIPFLFIVDFEVENPIAIPLSQVDPTVIRYNFQGFSNSAEANNDSIPLLTKLPISFDTYKLRFDKVMSHLKRGNTFLTNLTISTELKTDLTLEKNIFCFKGEVPAFIQR